MRPAGMPEPESFADRPHGTRLRYIAGCKCIRCRAANSSYETERAALRKAGLGNGLVPAWRVKRHLARLGAQGVGYKTVAKLAEVSASVLNDVSTGTKHRVRAETQRRVLGVTIGDVIWSGARCYIDATSTWEKIDWMLGNGAKKAWIAKALGAKTHALQLGRKRVTAERARAVAELYGKVRRGLDTDTPARVQKGRFAATERIRR